MDYAWGSTTFIPELLGRPCPSPKPAAELWMGAHPRGPSLVEIGGGTVPLDRLIREDPIGILGERAVEKFGERLPFLLKILAVDQPLSIQAHPDRDQARRGFRRENAAGIPVGDPGRNYRDESAKPELLCALTPFEALCGFRDPADIVVAFAELGLDALLPEAVLFRDNPGRENLRSLFRALLSLPEAEKRTVLERIGELVEEEKQCGRLPAPVRSWLARLRRLYPGDIGVSAPLFLNFVRLEPEEALFLAAGELHAYLNGAGVEIMASSDNVLRGGLTVKHIDGAELADILSCRCGPASAVRAEPGRGGEFVYPCPAQEFQLSRLLPVSSAPFRSGRRAGAEIVFCHRGRARALGRAQPAVDLGRGDSIFIPFGAGEYSIRGEAVLYRAALPSPGPTKPA